MEKQTLIDYLLGKVKEEDWHAVSDAANDLRVLEAGDIYRLKSAGPQDLMRNTPWPFRTEPLPLTEPEPSLFSRHTKADWVDSKNYQAQQRKSLHQQEASIREPKRKPKEG